MLVEYPQPEEWDLCREKESRNKSMYNETDVVCMLVVEHQYDKQVQLREGGTY